MVIKPTSALERSKLGALTPDAGGCAEGCVDDSDKRAFPEDPFQPASG